MRLRNCAAMLAAFLMLATWTTAGGERAKNGLTVRTVYRVDQRSTRNLVKQLAKKMHRLFRRDLTKTSNLKAVLKAAEQAFALPDRLSKAKLPMTAREKRTSLSLVDKLSKKLGFEKAFAAAESITGKPRERKTLERLFAYTELGGLENQEKLKTVYQKRMRQIIDPVKEAWLAFKTNPSSTAKRQLLKKIEAMDSGAKRLKVLFESFEVSELAVLHELARNLDDEGTVERMCRSELLWKTKAAKNADSIHWGAYDLKHAAKLLTADGKPSEKGSDPAKEIDEFLVGSNEKGGWLVRSVENYW